MDDLIGREIGQYRVTALLGSGTSATVYLAKQMSAFERPVAIKVMRSELLGSEGFAQRLELEARTIANLRHTHILRLIEFKAENNLVSLVMDYLPGGNLADLIGSETLPIDKIDRITAQIASALDYAHNQNIIHRDLKPQNVLLDEAGNAVLSDFGIAKIVSATTTLTQTGAIIGTPSYMSPEQWKGLPLDRRADIYAFGVVVYEMLTGALPFNADSASAMMYKHLSDRPSPVQEHRAELPLAVNVVLLRALAKEPEDRYETAGEFYKALHEALYSPASAVLVDQKRATIHRPSGTDVAMATTEVSRVKQRPFVLIGAVAAVAIIAVVALLLATSTGSPPVPTATAAGPLIAGQTRIDNRNVTQVYVPLGCFQMGSDPRADTRASDNELPAHDVCLSAFWIDQFEVTNNQFQAFVDAGGYTSNEWWTVEGWAWLQRNGFVGPETRGGADAGDQPRANISWYEADAYARWRGGRLPTEAEWEYAGRGTGNRIYAWGNGWQNGYGVINETTTGGASYPNSLAVGSRQLDRSWSGAYDLVGNVSEWVNDWLSPYTGAAQQDPIGAASGDQRVVRGGSYTSSPEAARLTFRIGRDPERRSPLTGFRVVSSTQT
ncbi:MAG: SUMF1/EgtB/PvdO family nonheme iron enzyme [Anaerolinea sp.]|nr:SUMF1/EgtB/PvdO family nonheme iron enzyme [Anaerolinea sp.]